MIAAIIPKVQEIEWYRQSRHTLSLIVMHAELAFLRIDLDAGRPNLGRTKSAVWSISRATRHAMPLEPCRHSVT
jgi:hypothetical protein